MKRFQRNLTSCLFFLLGATQLSTQGYAIGGGGGGAPPPPPPPATGGGAAPGVGYETVASYVGALPTYALTKIGPGYNDKMSAKIDKIRDLYNGQSHGRLNVGHCREDNGKKFATSHEEKYGDCLITKGNTDFVRKMLDAMKKKGTLNAEDCIILAVVNASNLLADTGDKFTTKNAGNAKKAAYKSLTGQCLGVDANRIAMWRTYLDS